MNLPIETVLEGLGVNAMPLLQKGQLLKYASLRASEFTAAHVQEFGKALGLSLPESTAEDLANQIATGDTDSLADWLTRPDNFEHVKRVIATAVNSSGALTAQCPWCDSAFIVNDENSGYITDGDVQNGHLHVQCPVCLGSFI